MSKKRLNKIAKQIADLEKQTNNENKFTMMSKMEELVSDCSMEELLKIDEIVMKKYLTN